MNLVGISSMAKQQVEHLWTVVPRCQERCGMSIYITRADIGGRASEEQLSQFDVTVVGSMGQRRPVVVGVGVGVQVGTILDAQLGGLHHTRLASP